jgi:hypothetical protein
MRARNVTHYCRRFVSRFGVDRDHFASLVPYEHSNDDAQSNLQFAADERVFGKALCCRQPNIDIGAKTAFVQAEADFIAKLLYCLKRDKGNGSAICHRSI